MLITKVLFCYKNLMIFSMVSGDKAGGGDNDHMDLGLRLRMPSSVPPFTCAR